MVIQYYQLRLSQFQQQLAKMIIKTDVIQNDLPLLLSKDSMKKSNVKIDFANDKVSFLDQNVDIILISSGHYAVPIFFLLTQKKYFCQ